MNTGAKIYALETTNFCNATCNWCPRSKMKRPRGLVQVETVKKVLNYCKETEQDYIALHHMGEPLMHPQIGTIISMFENSQIRTEFSTNGMLLAKRGREVLQSGLTRLRIAVDFAYSRKYFKTFLRNFLELSKEYDTEIRIHTINGNDLSVFDDFGSHVILENKCFDNWAGAIDGDSQLAPGPCYFREYNYVVVLWDGRVVPCCMDYNGSNIIGRIETVGRIKKNGLCTLCKNCANMQFASDGGWKI